MSITTQGEAIQQAVDAGLVSVQDITRWVLSFPELRACSRRSVVSATRQMVRQGAIVWPEPAKL